MSSRRQVFLLDVLRGFYMAWQGFLLLQKQRLLWKWAVFPAVVNLLVFGIVFALFLQFFDDIYRLATSFLTVASPTAWYSWLWVGPLHVFRWAIGGLILVVSVVVIYATFLLLGTTIASPFLAMLAQGVEDLVGHPTATTVRTTLPNQWAVLGSTLLDELRKLVFFVGIQLSLVLLGLLPWLTPLTVAASALFTMYFLPLEYAGFAMDRRHLHFAERRALLWQYRWRTLGFGAAASLTFFVPLLNFICLPILVVGGTLLILDIEEAP